MVMELKDFEPIFGQARAECANPSASPLRPFLFHVHAPDSSCLKIHVTDFHSGTWETVRSIEQLEDMQDSIGIGGSWTQFVDYVTASIKSEDVKVVFEDHSESNGAMHAKLVAQKTKGMPLVSISLTKLVDSAACEAMADVSLNLFKAFKRMKNILVQEEGRLNQLTRAVSAEQEKRESLENHLDMFTNRRKLQKMNSLHTASSSANVVSENDSISSLQGSPGKLIGRDLGSKKMTTRVVPTYRRAKVRGALLHDTEDNKDN